ncbi:MAG: hypothetical protein J2P37_15030, partial [Ktedonobacteraceae bacterium]|nr:hypothetical protein [Ktedonobacteraceae bacterium]
MDKKHLQTRPTEPRLRKKYVIWYVAAVLCILSIVLGLIFTIPRMNTAQRKSTPIAQATSQPQATGLVLPHKPPTPTPDPQHRPGSSIFPGLLFTPSSPWNMPIGTNVQLDPNSSAMARQLASGYHIPSMFEFGMPIYISTASDPLYSIYTDQDTFVANNPFHIPNTAAPALGVDKWLFVYDTTKQMIFEMWEAQKNGKTWTTQTGEVFSPTGDGVHQVSGAETSGNGASYFGGVIRAADIQRGYINHALSFASSFTAT